MKKFVGITILLVIVSACKTGKNSNTITDKTDSDKTEKMTNACPAPANCSIEIFANSTLLLKEDTIGKLYPVIEKGENKVLKYTYSLKGPEGTADGDYTETIHLEIPSLSKKNNLTNEELQEVKALYGKQCFCKGEAGYYKITNGNLSIINKANQIQISFQYSINETSQKSTNFSQVIEL